MNKKEISDFIYFIVYQWHKEWRKRNDSCFNNAIIDYLRNQLADDVIEWKSIHIDKRNKLITEDKRNLRRIESDISFRKFKFGFKPKPCEICGESRALNIAHIIPRSEGGPDDDWNLLFLCANHHYLFDNNILTKEEWNNIKWESKGSEAMHYINEIVVKKQQYFWDE